MEVPINKLNGIFFFGFLISPAIKVTLFHASLENIDPIMAVPRARIKAIPVMGEIDSVQFPPTPFDHVCDVSHMCCIF